jgi:hypothetical protein
MATTKTKPVRIFTADHAPLQLLADVERRTPAEVVHSALAEYLTTHRDELATIYGETQAFVRAGDIDGLTAALRREAGTFVADVAAGIPRTGRSAPKPESRRMRPPSPAAVGRRAR